VPLDERKRLHAVVTYQVLPKLQIGAKLFHQTADSRGTPATSSAGIGWRYDLNDNLHLLGYIRRGIENTDEMDRYSWYASILFTF
jgi:hypothetical protein